MKGNHCSPSRVALKPKNYHDRRIDPFSHYLVLVLLCLRIYYSSTRYHVLIPQQTQFLLQLSPPPLAFDKLYEVYLFNFGRVFNLSSRWFVVEVLIIAYPYIHIYIVD